MTPMPPDDLIHSILNAINRLRGKLDADYTRYTQELTLMRQRVKSLQAIVTERTPEHLPAMPPDILADSTGVNPLDNWQ
jgi:hypothetical protein